VPRLGVVVHDKVKSVRAVGDGKVVEGCCSLPLRPGMVGPYDLYLAPIPDEPSRFYTGWRFEYGADGDWFKEFPVVQFVFLYLPVILITALIFPAILISSELPSMTTG